MKKLQEEKKVSNDQRKEIKSLKKQEATMISNIKFDMEKYLVIFEDLKKNYGGNAKLVMKQARQFEWHLKFDMRRQGLKLGARLGFGSYGSAYKATGPKDIKGALCVKIPLNLNSSGKNVVSGSLKKEIEFLKSIHSIENQKDYREELNSIIEPIMPWVKLLQNEPALVTKCYPFTLLDLIYNKKH